MRTAKTFNADGSVTFRTEMSFGAGSRMRAANTEAVDAYDNALERVGIGEVNHLIDPTRIMPFEGGGPPVWSVATVPVPGGTLYLTYGFATAIDPDQPETDFELSIRVAGEPQMWPAMLLRALCRYMLSTGRELVLGDAMPVGEPITRFFAPKKEKRDYPDTAQSVVLVTHDPLLPTIQTPHGPVHVRRVLGLELDEFLLKELWTREGFTRTLSARDPSLTTSIARGSWARDPDFVAAIEAGSAQFGSDVAGFAAPKLDWWQDRKGRIYVTMPGREHAQRLARLLRARFPFGNAVLIHHEDPDKPEEVVLGPGDEPAFNVEGHRLILQLPLDHPLLGELVNPSRRSVTVRVA